METTHWQNISMAMAGAFQASTLVHQLATNGFVQSDAQSVLLKSLFVTNPDTPLAVYSNRPQDLQLGFETMIECLEGQRAEHQNEVLRYLLGMQHLQKKLQNNKAMLNQISQRLITITQQAEHFGYTHENVLANLADLYANTISTFSFRIQVMGDMGYLQQKRIANQVRSLLFAGIRSVMLWRQLGGNRWQFIFKRKQMLNNAKEMLEQIRRQQTINPTE